MKMLAKQHGSLYRWVWQYKSVMEVDGDACFMSTYVSVVHKGWRDDTDYALPVGWKWTLQLNMRHKKSKADDWWDWVSIKTSNRVGGNLGLFTSRFFPKGSMIGYYCRPVVWRCGKVGTGELSDDVLSSQGVELSPYGISLLNKDCAWHHVDPKPVGTVPGLLLYLGMQYMNSVHRSFVADSPEFDLARRNQNCLIYDDGTVWATKKIHPGMELLTGYNHDVHYVVGKRKLHIGMDDNVREGSGMNSKRKKGVM